MTAGWRSGTAGRVIVAAALILPCVCAPPVASAQTLTVLQGRVVDASGSVIPEATITVRDRSTGFASAAETDREGRYFVPALPTGSYTVVVDASGFRTEVIEQLIIDVGRTIVRNFQLAVGDRRETVAVHAEVPLVDAATAIVGHVVTRDTIGSIPLNGRHFTDVALLVPGSVAPSQTGFSARPIRGVGALAINTTGNREEAVGFLVNGVSSNNVTFGSFIFEPPLGSIQQIKVDNSTFAAEHGHVSGAIVNIVTRSGTDEFHGELFEYVRNDAFDARNFFEFTSSEPHRFQRNQFGGTGGGPIIRGRTYFFAGYEGLRQRQGVDMNSLVLSEAERAAVTNPVILQLLPLIPRANFMDDAGTARFIGSAPAIVDTNRFTLDVRHTFGVNDRLHAYYGNQRVRTVEPTGQGSSVPGFGLIQKPTTNLLTITETHVFGGTMVNEARFGRLRLNGGTFPGAALNPLDFGIRNGVTRAIGLPQMIVAGSLNFGGPGALPQGRFDTSYVISDTLSRTSGTHSMRLGGEYRHFINENFAEGTGIFNFPSVDAFVNGTANAFSITLGERRSIIDQRAVSLFFQDHVRVGNRVTLDLGLRYEWHVTPTERNDAFVVFDMQSASLLRVGVDVNEIYGQNNRNFHPRLGIAWDVSADGHMVVRAAYGRAADQPGTTAVRDTAGNPPFAIPLTASGVIPITSAIDTSRPAGLAPSSIDPAFRNATLQSWNVNLQRQLAQDMAVTLGYMGSKGSDLRISRNLNQPVGGIRPFPAVSMSSPIMPGTPLGNITQVESTGFSRYHGAWVSVTKRLSRGLQFDTSYTWSKSMDTNSLNSSGFAVQDGYDIRNQYGLSDFDARHRFIVSAGYSLPFSGHVLIGGWHVAAVVQSQSGNPVNIVTSNSTLNGTANTVRPDVTGPIRIIGSVERWFDTTAFAAVNRFGNLGRNVVIGPAFHNTDLSIVKHIRPGQPFALQLRVDVFDLFNHPNFGPPGNIVGTPTFGAISRTRLPTGEGGSSRQIQFAARLSF